VTRDAWEVPSVLYGRPTRIHPGDSLGNLRLAERLNRLSYRKVTGAPIEYKVAGRRPGDPPRLVANADKARRELGWTPEYVDLVSIVQTAWRYMEARPASMAR